jgi:type I restriction enzyme S subunit
MSFPRYPGYKPTNSSWLRTIPEHWEMGQSRRRFSLRNEPAQNEDEQLTASQKHGIIKQAEFIESEGRRVVEVIKGQDILKHVEPGDFVISMRSFQGGLEYSRVKGSISSAYVMLAPMKEVAPRFFAWLFKSQPYVQALQSTTNLVRDGQALRFSNFCQVDIPIIPDKEQLAIASFLDRETAKIDALIAEQLRLIELLQEKRQVVISQAVTKGLNPNAPMKDSGVEWLGEVPEHWECLPLKRYVTGSNAGEVIDKSFWGGSNELLYTCAIEPLWCDYSGFPEWKRTTAGDLLLTRNGTPYVHQPVPKSIYTNVVQRITILPGKNREYLAVALQNSANYLKGYGVSIESLNYQMWSALPVPLPPLEEQASILEATRDKTEKLDALLLETKSGIQLLQERRSALISAAVTGQIDVRGLVPEAAEQ